MVALLLALNLRNLTQAQGSIVGSDILVVFMVRKEGEANHVDLSADFDAVLVGDRRSGMTSFLATTATAMTKLEMRLHGYMTRLDHTLYLPLQLATGWSPSQSSRLEFSLVGDDIRRASIA